MHKSRPGTDNRDRGDLLVEVFSSNHKHHYDTRHDEPGIARTRGQWRLSWWQLSRGDASAVRPGPAGSTSNRGAKYLNATIQTEKCLSQVSQRRK